MAEEKAWLPLELVKVSSDYLTEKQCPTPRLDAEVLLCRVLGLERRVDLYAGFERKVSGKELANYRELIRRRAAREPVSRILGQRDFMGLTFAVTPDVLSPRPETEILVEAALERLRPAKRLVSEDESAEEAIEPEADEPDDQMNAELERLLDSYSADVDSEDDIEKEPAKVAAPARPPPAAKRQAGRPGNGKKNKAAAETSCPGAMILDLGTGSGCIALSMAALLYNAQVMAADASPKALAVAKKNAEALGVTDRVHFRQGDWFAACRDGERFDAILSNPPYLIEGDADIWPEVSKYDPPLALYGGRDGLDCYRRIIPSAPEWLAPDGWLLFEVGAGQADTIADMLKRRGFREVATVKDYGGVARVVAAKAPEA